MEFTYSRCSEGNIVIRHLFQRKSYVLPFDIDDYFSLCTKNDMQRGVFRPARIYFSSIVAGIFTFFASGFLHEILMSIIFFINNDEKDENGNCESCYKPSYGRQIMFFMWFGIVVTMEYIVTKYFPKIHQSFKKLPKPVIIMIGFITGMPVLHLTFGDMVIGKYFHHSQMSLPLFVLIDK